MSTQTQKAKLFSALHIKGDPVILFNIWDAGSAKAVSGAGAKAIATGSAPVAMANGFKDGEKIPLKMSLGNVTRIVNATDLPVTMDFEGCYGVDPDTIAKNVARALETGVIGFNFEDQIIGGDGLYPVKQQAGRVNAVRQACDRAGIEGFINARTDIFLKAKPEAHSDDMVSAAIERVKVYADAGASGFFVPGLKDEAMIGRLCDEADLPVNILSLPGAPENPRLAELGVARISYGPVPYFGMINWLENAASEALTSLS
jgi:2-methylisocitrate lyase-like PEP mutase family enzyme